MWPRNLNKTMGFDQADFIKALKLAFTEDSIIQKLAEKLEERLEEKIIKPLKFEIDTLTELNKTLQGQIEQFSKDNAALSKEVTDLRTVVKSKDEQIQHMNIRISDIEQTLDDHEQYSRRNSLRISGVPDNPEGEDLQDKILYLVNKRLSLDPPLGPECIDRMHRLGKPGGSAETSRGQSAAEGGPDTQAKVKPDGSTATKGPRAVLVKFATYAARQRVFANRRLFRVRPAKANLTDVENEDQEAHEGDNAEVDGGLQDNAVGDADRSTDGGTVGEDGTPINPRETLDAAVIYVNEDLTRSRSNLLWEARKRKKAQLIQNCWSYDGRVMISDSYGRVHLIHNENELLQKCKK